MTVSMITGVRRGPRAPPACEISFALGVTRFPPVSPGISPARHSAFLGPPSSPAPRISATSFLHAVLVPASRLLTELPSASGARFPTLVVPAPRHAPRLPFWPLPPALFLAVRSLLRVRRLFFPSFRLKSRLNTMLFSVRPVPPGPQMYVVPVRVNLPLRR